MKIPARGSILFGLIALTTVLFNFQPTVEAKNALNTAIDSQETVQQINQPQSDSQTSLQTENQQQNLIGNSSEAKITLSEGRAFRATAYCLQGRTANGGGVRRGIVAADPRVLPLGTRIQLSAGSYSGTYTVADTGGAIKGRILDIWVPSCSEAIRFGRKSITVSIVGKTEKKRKSNS